MRSRPFIGAGEEPRRYSEIVAERRASDPRHQQRERALATIHAIEADALDASDPAERKRLQCEAEALRCALDEEPQGRFER